MRKKFLVEQLAALKQKRQAENTRLATLAAAGSEVPTAEVTACLAIDDEVTKLQAELDGIEKLEASAKARVAEEQALAPAGGTQVHNRAEDRPFGSFGEFLASVAVAGTPGGLVDPRLRNLTPSGANEGVPSDGGFFVREEWASLLYNTAFDAANLASRCRRIPLSGANNRLKIPVIAETSRATGSRFGGIRVYRRSEADTVTASKPKFDYFEMALESMMGIAYATDELIQDYAAIESIFTQGFTEEFSFVIDDEILRGDGAGKMLGILNSPALVTASKVSGQAADTIVYENIPAMYTRMPGRNRSNAVWIYNQGIEAQLYTMFQSVGTAVGFPVFLPPGGASSTPYATLYGRPMLPVEQCSAIGDLGDIMFVDLSQYAIIEKGGLKAAQSMHVRFLYEEMTYRWSMRNNGMPTWKAAITPYKGASSLSPFVTLEAR
jgi:HK97 family phage major capsid protein